MVVAILLVAAFTGCDKGSEKSPKAAPTARRDAASPLAVPDEYTVLRNDMVQRTIVDRGITDPQVVTAMRLTPRHAFVPEDSQYLAYEDRPIPIGFEKTISQPFIIAQMTQLSGVKAGDRVLEIGTGSGYQAAVLAVLGAKVYTIEIHEELGARTQGVLKKAGFPQVNMKIGDGYFGWPEAAPFDAILITCATPEIPPPLLQQLRDGGRIVAPIGDDFEQYLDVVTKVNGRITTERGEGVRFGPMLGEIEKRR
jgi:protein-L-isoaspartate(D-aspartate) O-methyltransferase